MGGSEIVHCWKGGGALAVSGEKLTVGGSEIVHCWMVGGALAVS